MRLTGDAALITSGIGRALAENFHRNLDPPRGEILVERVKKYRFAEGSGKYHETFATNNSPIG